MSRLRQFFFALAAAAVVGSVHAQNPPASLPKISSTFTNLLPPEVPSPVAYFRRLLAMTPTERNDALTNRSAETRARILKKVHEYKALNPDERELRLQATELRWYLTPLMRLAPDQRGPQLDRVPAELRELVQSRLKQWDLLPPGIKTEFLANDQTLHYFARVEPTNQPAASPQQQKLAEQFDQFFELTRAEKQRTLGTLSEAERAQMEKTLEAFDQLPPQQRRQCVRNYAKFAGMGAAERAEFLKNAESWARMSPAERQSWRDLVAHVPLMPPTTQLPASIMPPAPSKPARASVATN